MHQLIITKEGDENVPHKLNPADSLNEETIESSVACLITSETGTVENEPWLKSKTTGFRQQKATTSIKEKLQKVEDFSDYLVSPMRKNYKIFFGSLMVVFKAIQSWLHQEISEDPPSG